MRMRNKPWVKEELSKSKIYISNPEEYKGKWKEVFRNQSNPIHLELGCGKGFFVKKAALQNQDVNYIAIDLVDVILGVANRNIIEEFDGKEINNLILTRYDVEEIEKIFSSVDNIQRIYINFCNPWPKPRHKKRRLTYTRQLEKYKTFLQSNGEIYFKTDDEELFRESLEYFSQVKFKTIKTTTDLENTPDFWNNIETEHEIKFKNQGISIKAGIFSL